MVNPHDEDGIAERIVQAIDMSRAERIQRMRHLKEKIETLDVFHWVNCYLDALTGEDLASFPTIQDYAPSLITLPDVAGVN